jgi:AraC-like DNA-binding protein
MEVVALKVCDIDSKRMMLRVEQGHSETARNVRRNRRRVMRRLEDAVMANPDEPLYMAELCAQVRASYWTLRDCCLEYLGMSPKRYLWLRRMHLVRRALKNADAERTTVTEIASDYRFWEFGRFSVPTARSSVNHLRQRCVGRSMTQEPNEKRSAGFGNYKICIVHLLRELYPPP